MKNIVCIIAVLFVCPALQAAGVRAGHSSLISVYDYTDEYTATEDGGLPGRNMNGQWPTGLSVETKYGCAPARSWSPTGFLIGDDLNVHDPEEFFYPGPSGAGSDTGLAEIPPSAYAYGFDYGLRDQFIVQQDFVPSVRSFSIWVAKSGHLRVDDVDSLEIMFENDTTVIPAFKQVGLRWHGVNYWLPGRLPPPVGQWVNVAVRFDIPGNHIEIYYNEVSQGIINLSTVNGGDNGGMRLYNNRVGIFMEARTWLHYEWCDNFQVGGSGPIQCPSVITEPNDSNLPLKVYEQGPTSYQFKVKLTGQPNANVSVRCHPVKPASGYDRVDLGSGPGADEILVFTPAQWNTAKILTVTAVDDTVMEGAELVDVQFSTTSTDPLFNNGWGDTRSLQVIDNDSGAVRVGESTIIGTLDYSDTFTLTENGGESGREYSTSNYANGVVENHYGNPPATFTTLDSGTEQSGFMVADDNRPLNPNYPGGSHKGSNTGFATFWTSTNFGMNYGLRNDFTVQCDFGMPWISSAPWTAVCLWTAQSGTFNRGTSTGATGCIVVNFLNDPANKLVGVQWIPTSGGSSPAIWYPGLVPPKEGTWDNVAVRFDQPGDKLDIYITENLIGSIPLSWVRAGFEDPSVAIYSNRIGLSTYGPWPGIDNWQVGQPRETCGSWGYLKGDFNKDCYVTMKDLDIQAQNWLTTVEIPCQAKGDTDNDCTINFSDFAAMAADWLKCSDPAGSGCAHVQ